MDLTFEWASSLKPAARIRHSFHPPLVLLIQDAPETNHGDWEAVILTKILHHFFERLLDTTTSTSAE